MRCYPSRRLALCLPLILSVLMDMAYGELAFVKIVRKTRTKLIKIECDKPKMSILKVPDLDISFCKCPQGFYLQLDTEEDPGSASCKPCWICKHEQVRKYEAQPCRPYTDALCCPEPSMVAKTTVHGYEVCENPQAELPSTRDSSSGSPNTRIELPGPTSPEEPMDRTDKMPSEIATETKSGPYIHDTDGQSETSNSNESQTEGQGQGQSESDTGTESNNEEETRDFNRGGAVVDFEDFVGCLGGTFGKKGGVVERYTCKRDRQTEKDADTEGDKCNDILNRLKEMKDLIESVKSWQIGTLVLVFIIMAAFCCLVFKIFQDGGYGRVQEVEPR